MQRKTSKFGFSAQSDRFFLQTNQYQSDFCTAGSIMGVCKSDTHTHELWVIGSLSLWVGMKVFFGQVVTEKKEFCESLTVTV